MYVKEYDLNSSDRLIVDIGRYTIAYTVATPDNSIKYFKIESFTPDIADLFEDKTIRFIEAVIKSCREIKMDFQTIEDIILVIPTKDILLSNNGNINQKVIKKLLEDQYNITEDTGLAQSVSRPYKIGNRFFAPISFYDENINLLITELNKIGDPIKDVVRGNVIFQTSIYRMIKVAGNTKGKVAVVDSSFNSTRVLLAKDGHPVEYNEFELCGEDMLKTAYSKSSKSISDIVKIINSYEDAFNNSIPEAIAAHNYLKKEAERGIIPHLKKTGVEKIIFMGGLSNTDYLDNIGIDIERLEINYTIHDDLRKSGVESIPEPVNYKIEMSLSTPSHGGLLDSRNVDIILGERDINDYSPIMESEENIIMKTEEIIGDENEYNNDELVKMSKEIKNSLGLTERKDKKSSLKLINLEKDNSENETLIVKSVTPDQINFLDNLKKSYKEPSQYEKKTPVIVTGAIVFVLLLFTVAFMNYQGYINNNLFKLAGIQQPEIEAYKIDYAKQVDDKVAKTVKQLELNGSSITSEKNISGNNNKVQVNISIPKEMDFKYNFGFYFTKNIELLKNKDIDINIAVDDKDKIRNNYLVTIKYLDLKKNKGTSGGFNIEGATKWTEEEYRLFFDANDYDDFINGTRKVGDPSRAEKEKGNIGEEGQQNDTNQAVGDDYEKFIPGISNPEDHTIN